MRRARSPQRRRMGPRGSGSAAISAATRAGMASAATATAVVGDRWRGGGAGAKWRSDPMQLNYAAAAAAAAALTNPTQDGRVRLVSPLQLSSPHSRKTSIPPSGLRRQGQLCGVCLCFFFFYKKMRCFFNTNLIIANFYKIMCAYI
jgi:hypothetical protein